MTDPNTPDRKRRAELARDEEAFEVLLSQAARVRRQPARRPRQAPGTRRWVQGAAAAAIVLATAVWLGVRDPSPLPGQVIAHVRHEPAALVRTAESVPVAEMNQVLRQAGAELVGAVGTVSYVRLCPFNGRMVAHFVVQGEKGPVTVLLLPHENVVTTMAVREDGFVGTLVPLEIGGSIAVVGEPDESLDAIRDALVAAVRWQV